MLRDQGSQDFHCFLLSGLLSAEDSTTYGVNSTSPLNKIDHFHVANSQSPQDVMHILLKSVIPLETKLVIFGLMEEGYFSSDQFNERISNFLMAEQKQETNPQNHFRGHYFSPNLALFTYQVSENVAVTVTITF